MKAIAPGPKIRGAMPPQAFDTDEFLQQQNEPSLAAAFRRLIQPPPQVTMHKMCHCAHENKCVVSGWRQNTKNRLAAGLRPGPYLC